MANKLTHTPWAIESRLPDRSEAAFAARVLAACNGHDLDVWSEGLWPFDADGWLTPMAAMEGVTLPELLAHVELIWPGSFWLLAKGKLSSAEPLFGFQVLFGADEVLAEGEGETAVAAIHAAIAKATGRAALNQDGGA